MSPSAQSIIQNLRKESIKSLCLTNEYSLEDIRSISQALEYNSSVTYLNLKFDCEVKAQVVVHSLYINRSVDYMQVTTNFGDPGIIPIANLLEKKCIVKTIFLDFGWIGESGARSLVNMIKLNKGLKKFYFRARRYEGCGIETIVEALILNKTLDTFSADRNALGDQEAKFIAESLKMNYYLVDVDLSYNSIGKEGARAIADLIKVNNCLKKINLANNSIGFEGLKFILDAWEVNENVENIVLLNNSFGIEGARLYAKKFRDEYINICDSTIDNDWALEIAELIKNTSIRSLDISLCEIYNIEIIADAIAFNNTLHSVNFSYDNFDEEDFEVLIEAFKKNTSLQLVGLDGNDFDSALLGEISCVMSRNRKKIVLDAIDDIASNRKSEISLSSYRIDFCEFRILAKELCTNYYLTKLSLSSTNIRCVEMVLLAEALHSNSHLLSLNISNTNIGNDGMFAIAEALKTNSSLRILNISFNHIRTQGANALGKSFLFNNSLEELCLNYCKLQFEQCSAILTPLMENISLQKISMNGNSIGDRGAQVIAQLLRRNHVLQSIDIGECGITADGEKSILESLAFNHSLLNLSYKENDFDHNNSILKIFLEKNYKRFKNESKMITFELFKRASIKMSCMIEISITSIIFQLAGF
jgi:Ran GTPase-activating protein (RanGAP) involved in mRNA processing and transport